MTGTVESDGTIEVDRVSKYYGSVAAVVDASLSIGGGETVALVGHNGAGKTTLMKLLLGLVRPTSGRLRVLGQNPAAGEFAARRYLGYLPESVSFNTSLSGREILSFYARLKGWPVHAAMALIDDVGLGAAAQRRVGTYSKGMRQRLGLAQALIGEPRLLLLDEPTTGLDPALRLEFYDIVEDLRRRGTTVVLSSHALAELGERAQRVVIMNKGVIVANGSIDELRRLSDLPAKIRLVVAQGEAARVASLLKPVAMCRAVNGQVVELEAGGKEKIEVLRRATTMETPASDISVVPPSLDELYAHFQQTGGGSS
jgi:Cu-processing system ATP-binding protein